MLPRFIRSHRLLLFTAVTLSLLPAPALAGDAYYMLVFGSQRTPRNPNYSHSFATVVRGSWNGPGAPTGRVCLEQHTISWLPGDLEVRTLALHPQCGVKLSLDDTLRYAQENHERVSMWGPFQIEP